MISNVFLYKNLRFIWIFYPDLCQYWIKFALFTSNNPDFSALPRCCVLWVHWLVSRKDSEAFRRNTRMLTITNERLELW